jgi:hypothetical protein
MSAEKLAEALREAMVLLDPFETVAKVAHAKAAAALAAHEAEAKAVTVKESLTHAPLTDEQIDAIAEPYLRDLGGDHWYSGERGIPEGSAPDFARAVIAAANGGKP